MKKLRFQILLLAVLLVCVGLSQAQLITAQSATPSSTGATIAWTTAAAANSQVLYGLTSTYGSQTTLDAAQVTSHSEPITGLTSGTLYHYQIISIDSVGNTVTSPDATFTTTSSVTITLQPVAVTLCAGGVATFTSTATGSPTPTVQWQRSTTLGGSTYADITGATSTTYSFTTAAADNGFNFRAVFTGSGTATSSGVSATVNTIPVMATHPVSQTVSAGATATFTAASSGGQPSPTVQWIVSTDGGGTETNVPGATSTTLTLTGVTLSMTGYQYKAVFTNTCGHVTSAPAYLTVVNNQVYNISTSTSSSRSGGTFLQGQTISGTNYIFTSLQSNQATFNIAGVSEVDFFLDDPNMLNTPINKVFLAPFDFYPSGAIPAFVQQQNHLGGTSGSSVAITLSSPPTLHNFMVAEVAFDDATHNVTSVSNPANTFISIGCTRYSTSKTSCLFYKPDIANGAPQQTVTAVFNGTVPYPELNVVEYSGMNLSSVLDAFGGAGGAGPAPASGSVTPTYPTELVFGAGTTLGNFSAAGTGFTSRHTPSGTITEDKFTSAIAAQNATAVSSSAGYVMQIATFRSMQGIQGWDTTKIANGSHTITQKVFITAGGTEVDSVTFTINNTVHKAALTWTAGAATNPITFNVYRGTASGGPYTRIASGVSAAAYTDTSVIAGTTYYYVVSEVDQVTILESGFSNQVTAVIPTP